MDEDGGEDMLDLESLNYDDLDSVSKLQKTQRYNEIMQKVEDALQKGTDFSNQGSILEEDPEYQLIVGFSTATSQFRVGCLEQADVFQSTLPALRTRACRLIAAKSTLAARIDSIRGDPTGKAGRNLLEEIRKKIEKWQEPPPAKLPKPLPAPDSEPKKNRGGRRLRKMKERYAQTDMMKLANRMQFGVPEESSLGQLILSDGLGEDYGMLGQAGSGKLHVSAAQSKLAAKVAKKFKEKSYGSSGATSGRTSSLAFTPVQGIELSNPQSHGNLLGSETQSTYFSETGTISKIKRT
ncbi:hypothetical protein E2562_007395 [Oryza meyeriana var. granulata]|uniref:Nop domain-containing protein n=1 Tax=Oryza meyeriana var. granulata TaxID=110450 RepID=A0A6G1CZV4_9ORYZ|nr:hypothetical protein E2562_007395 [Oryza meyeriana var. granulata]